MSELEISEFKTLNGWLENFKNRHSILVKTIAGEASLVKEETVSCWMEKKNFLIPNY